MIMLGFGFGFIISLACCDRQSLQNSDILECFYWADFAVGKLWTFKVTCMNLS